MPRFLTDDIEPIEGGIKRRPADFVVEEIPAYEPCGSGEHLYLFVEKTDKTTFDLVEAVARHYGVGTKDVGCAGLKDKKAVTRQLVSVYLPGKDEKTLEPFGQEGMTTLWADRHRNKLRRGHLRGNRFRIKLRGVSVGRVLDVQRILQRVAAEGLPNYFGPQRFGDGDTSDRLGRHLLLNDARGFLDVLLGPIETHPYLQPKAREAYAAERYAEAYDLLPSRLRDERRALAALRDGGNPKYAVRTMSDMGRRLFVSAFQSRIFNAVLSRRMDAGTHRTVLLGDLVRKHENGAVFSITPDESIEDAQARCDRLEVTPTGPMWGPGMTRASHEVDALERAVLEDTGVSVEDFTRCTLVKGTSKLGQRRSLTVPVTETAVEAGSDEHGPYIECGFALPSGAYATTLIREITKNDRHEHLLDIDPT
jgi:tRNA pseudouridine13 synthase